MSLVLVITRSAETMLDATCRAETATTLDVTAQHIVGRALRCATALAFKPPDGFPAFRRHPQKLDRREAAELLSLKMQPRVFPMVRALLRTEALTAFQECGADLDLISAVTFAGPECISVSIAISSAQDN